jgi:trans-2,3-dihydro-3-hydroxyanthranilate isomerase
VSDHRYFLFDVFTDVPFAGNQLAVFPDGDFDGAAMQRIAAELNLSETVFLTRGSGDVPASLRIFTPARELSFAGHPTIGAALALVEHLGWVEPSCERFALREGVGDVPIAIERGSPTTAWLTTPAWSFGGTLSREVGAAILTIPAQAVRPDLPPQIVTAGNSFLYIGLDAPGDVDAALLDERAVAAALGDPRSISGVYLFAQTSEGAYARLFAPMSGITEDPATGSATGPLYAYLAAHRALPLHRERFTNEQGVAMGRRSTLHVRIAWNDSAIRTIEVGGSAVLVGEGRFVRTQ